MINRISSVRVPRSRSRRYILARTRFCNSAQNIGIANRLSTYSLDTAITMKWISRTRKAYGLKASRRELRDGSNPDVLLSSDNALRQMPSEYYSSVITPSMR